jgi:hypothetical protein
MNYQYELVRDGLTRVIIVKSHPYDLIEFTIKQTSFKEDGKILTDNGHTTFYETKEFLSFFGPIIEDLKKEIDNANSVQNG